jgi:hypothetical protein
LPNLVQSGIDEHVLTVKVLSSHEQWVGLTYKEDKENVQQFIQLLTDKKYYPKSFTHE